MHTADTTEPRPTFRLRFSLFALFLFMTALCLLLAWWMQPRQCRVETMIVVDDQPPVLIGSSIPIDPMLWNVFRRTQLGIELLPHVAIAALRDPSIASLPIITSRDDPVKWVAESLEILPLQSSKVLTLRMRGPAGSGDDLRQVLDAVCSALLREVYLAEERRRTVMRDALARQLTSLDSELAEKSKNLAIIKRQPMESDLDIELRAMDLENSMALRQQVAKQLKIIDINSGAPPRVRTVLPASVTFDGMSSKTVAVLIGPVFVAVMLLAISLVLRGVRPRKVQTNQAHAK